MSKFGRTPVVLADRRQRDTETTIAVATDTGDEERIDKRPNGRAARFVSPQGDVMSLPLSSNGDPKRVETESRNRAAYAKKGFVPHGQCPLLHHTASHADWQKLPASLREACTHDPKTMARRNGVLYAEASCPHIEWLMVYRRDAAAEAYRRRNHVALAAEQRAAEKRELEAMQVEAMREVVAKRARKTKAGEE